MRDFDFLVIGGGIAGMLHALRVAKHGRVALLAKRGLDESNTAQAQGGLAAVWDTNDSTEDHVADTIKAGAGLCEPSVVRTVVGEGPHYLRELIELGVEFSRDSKGDYALGLEGGHSHRRVLHAADSTGREIVRALSATVQEHPQIEVFENHYAIDLLVDEKIGLARGQAQCWGAYVLDTVERQIHTFRARTTLLATGGAGKVYLYTSNPDIASGDGIAMAYRAGCRVADMEFIQFHPTCLYHPEAKSFLVTEAMRGEGAVLRRPDGSSFMLEHHERAELAPRDIVARAIDYEMKANGFDNVLLDITARGRTFIEERFPAIYQRCRTYGIDPPTTPSPWYRRRTTCAAAS